MAKEIGALSITRKMRPSPIADKVVPHNNRKWLIANSEAVHETRSHPLL